jgi:cation:H+ antiporter
MDLITGYIPTVIIMLAIIWGSSSLIVNGINNLAHKIHISPFMVLVSFVLLGLLTSATEITLAINSHISKVPEVSAGNLFGGVIVMYLLIIPILAIMGKGVSMGKDYSKPELVITLFFLILPVIFIFDGQISIQEAIIMISSYGLVMLFIYEKHKKGILIKTKGKPRKKDIIKIKGNIEIFKVVAGVIILLFASEKLIEVLVNSANAMNVSPFLVSLLTLSIGTNLPELAMTIRSILSGSKDIALGHYLGSSATNPVILSFLAIANGGLIIDSNFIQITIFTLLGLALFYIFIVSKNILSRGEGLILLGVYVLFVASELIFR